MSQTYAQLLKARSARAIPSGSIACLDCGAVSSPKDGQRLPIVHEGWCRSWQRSDTPTPEPVKP